MFLSELFEQLTYGELSQTAIGGLNAVGIGSEHYKQVVAHVNLALTDLHKRFPLRFEEVLVQQYDWIQEYHLKAQYAETNTDSTEEVKYLIDSVYEPFKNNVLKIEQVFSEIGEERPINDTSKQWSVFTPKPKTVLIPYNDEHNTFSVIYRANHPKIIVDDDFDPENVELDIVDALIAPICIYVAGRIVGNMGSTDNLNASSHYQSRYELALLEVEKHDLIPKDTLYNDRLEKNGWV